MQVGKVRLIGSGCLTSAAAAESRPWEATKPRPVIRFDPIVLTCILMSVCSGYGALSPIRGAISTYKEAGRKGPIRSISLFDVRDGGAISPFRNNKIQTGFDSVTLDGPDDHAPGRFDAALV